MDSQGHDIQSPGAGRTVEGLAGRRILLGITGSIAAYKAAVLCRLLKCAGAEVRVVMTPLAKQFITPLTMATLSKNPILVEFFDPENGAWNSHVSLGEWADCYLIAPATANTLAKMACGIADNLLLTTYLSARCPVVVSPAMDLDMYAHPATQENLRRLAERGVRIVQPAEGELASGLTGKGRMAEPADIAAFVGQLFGGENPEKKKSLQGRRFVVTAGATIEAIDPVRFISNHSTGKMGYAIAGALAARGGEMCITLRRTRDIAAELGARKGSRLLVGFALETHDEQANAEAKLAKKNFDFIVLNSLRDAGAGFRGDTNKVTFIDRSGREELPLMPKSEVAERIADKIESLLK